MESKEADPVDDVGGLDVCTLESVGDESFDEERLGLSQAVLRGTSEFVRRGQPVLVELRVEEAL